MSLSYPGKSSWSLGYVPSSSTTSSSLSSRPRSRYGNSSGTGRLDYSSSSYSSLARHDRTGFTTYTPTASRSDIYSPASSLSTRSFSRLADSGSRSHLDAGTVSHISSGSRGHLDAGTVSHTSSGSGREIKVRRNSSSLDASPTSSSDVSGSSEHVSRIRGATDSYGSYRSSRSKDAGDGASSLTGAVSSRAKNDDPEMAVSAKTDHSYSTRKRERRRDSQENVVSPDENEDRTSVRLRSFRRQSSGERERKDDNFANVEDNNPPGQGITCTDIVKPPKENDKASMDDKPTRSHGSVHPTLLPVPEHSRFSSHATKSPEVRSTVHDETRTQKSALEEVSTEPSEVSHSFRRTSSRNAFSGSLISELEEDFDTKKQDNLDVQGSSRELQCEDNSKKPRANGTTKVGTRNARTTSSGSSINSINAISVAQAEIIRLESLCEARTKELTRSKIELRSACQAFDAMAALVNYCCVDLNAFECIPLANKLDVLQLQLADRLSQIADLNSQKNVLETSLAEIILEKEELTRRVHEAGETIEKERDEHSKVTHEMDDTHNAALTAQRDELTSKHDENIKKLNHFYDKQIDMLRLAHDRQVSDMKNEGKLEVNALKISHLEEIQELRNRHDSQMEELHKQHRNKLEDITHRFESIKLTLSEKVETLRGECDELARRARSSEDALQRDADAKVQIALAPFLTLPKEIESLKMVLEMRNEEIQKLRGKNMEVEKQLEEIPISREKIISLQQKVENLEAIINIKTDHEKQLHEKCQILMRKYDRESRANKRLSMDYEQVVWRMSQSSEFGSCESLTKRHFSRSPPHSKEGSPDGRLRPMSPSGSQSDVVLRVKKRSSHSISEGDRQLRSRSATFVLEKCDSSSSHSPSLSPQLKQKRWRKKSQAEEVVAESEKVDRMCHSAGAEILSDLARQQLEQEELLNKTNLKDIAAPIQMSSDDMTYSYARSLSGVSDSGMYDSMTKSDVLDSSIVSTDSEWGTSINLSNNCDSKLEDLESGPVAGEFHLLNDITEIDAKMLSSNDSRNIIFSNVKNGSSSSTRSSSSESRIEDDPQGNSYQAYVTLPQGPGVRDDIVFNESVSKDSC